LQDQQEPSKKRRRTAAQEETGMSAPSDPYESLQAASNRHRVQFLKNELALCLSFSLIAARKYETGNQESAEKSMANAEKAYETVRKILSDRKHSTHLTEETIQESTWKLERLRDKLDGLRFRK